MREYIPKNKPRKRRQNGNWKKKWKTKLFKQSNRCVYCNCILTLDTATIDHIKPRSKGGTDHPTNLILACKKCNVAKGNMEE